MLLFEPFVSFITRSGFFLMICLNVKLEMTTKARFMLSLDLSVRLHYTFIFGNSALTLLNMVNLKCSFQISARHICKFHLPRSVEP